MEKMLEQISFDAPDSSSQQVRIDAQYVRERLAAIVSDEDLSRFIL
jgi:ATP-dependent HslUV protease ATP-binding subunit HslU